jgi:Putative Ig domain
MAGGTLRLRGTVRHVREVAVRGQLTALVIAGAMLTAGLGTSAAASAATTPPLAITTTALPCAGGVCSLAEGNVGVGFDAYVVATGGAPSQEGDDPAPYTWAITSGSLPAGLTFDNEYDEAVLSGTPTKAGTSSFTVQVTDSAGGGTVSQAFTIAIGTGNLDQVVITTAVYYLNASYHHVLHIIASDANTGVTLTVYVTSTGQKISGQLDSGDGEFQNNFIGTIDAFNGSNPSTITIKSSLGGTATSAVTVCPAGTGYC